MNFLVSPVIHPLIQILITFLLCSGILKLGNIINIKIFKSYNYYLNNSNDNQKDSAIKLKMGFFSVIKFISKII